jgi:transcriptional regulator with XRE-family HTH domain
MTEATAFGPQLRRRRMARDVSLAQLAEQVHYSKGYLSKIENGLRQPTQALARLCDNALHGDGGLIALAARALAVQASRDEVGDVEAGSAYDAERWVMEMGENGSIWFQALNRRQALFAGAASLMTLSGGFADARPGEHAAALGTFTTMFGQLRQLGQQTSPTLLLPTLIAQTHTVQSLATRTSGATRDKAFSLASRYAEYTGWMAQEAGQERVALWWTDLAVSLAQTGSDDELAAYSMVRRALMTMYAGDGAQTVALAEQAQQHRAAGPRVLGLAAQREAQGHALLGDYARCCSALDRADELLTKAVPTEPETVLGTSSVSNPAALTQAWCLHDLGKPAEAAHAFDRELAGVGVGRVRFRARWGVRRALSYATSGEIEHACHLTEELLSDVELVDSATVRWDLQELTRTFARWLNHPPVRALYPALTSTLYVGRAH